jgi:hypothetical protein
LPRPDAQIGQLVHRHELHRAPHPGAKTSRRAEPAHSLGGVRTGHQDQVVGTDPGGLELGSRGLSSIGVVEDGQRPARRVADQPPAHRSFAGASTALGALSSRR